jgi:hypothetical protein
LDVVVWDTESCDSTGCLAKGETCTLYSQGERGAERIEKDGEGFGKAFERY